MSKALIALGNVWKDIPSVSKDATNPHFKSKYVTLPAIVDALRPILAEHGVYFVQRPVECESGIGLQTLVVHAESGDTYDAGTIYVPVDRQNAQGVGSAMTYARRYALCAVFGIVADEDDDGNAASRTNGNGVRKVPPKEPEWEKTAKGALIKWTGMSDKSDLNAAWKQVIEKVGVEIGDTSDASMRKAHAYITAQIQTGADFQETINAG